MNKTITSITLVGIVSIALTGCGPRSMLGGGGGAATGALAGAGLTKMVGGSGGTALVAGLGGAAVGGMLGAYAGDKLDQEAMQRAKQASLTRQPVVWEDKQGDEWMAVPSKKSNREGNSTKVKVINKRTGKEVVIDM